MTKFNLIILCFLFGCSTPELTGEYDSADWFELGRRDGVRGAEISEYNRYVELTQKTKSQPPDRELYLSGRASGLSSYCQGRTGFQIGRNGLPYNKVCTGAQETEFLQMFRVGQEIRRLETSNEQLLQQINQLTGTAQNSAAKNEKTKLEQQIKDLKDSHAKNESTISELTKKIPN